MTRSMTPGQQIKNQVAKTRALRGAFKHCFNGPDGAPHADGLIVLTELRRFCYGDKPTIKMSPDGRIDPYASISAAARQEVYQRIMALLNIGDQDLARMEQIAYQEEQADE